MHLQSVSSIACAVPRPARCEFFSKSSKEVRAVHFVYRYFNLEAKLHPTRNSKLQLTSDPRSEGDWRGERRIQ